MIFPIIIAVFAWCTGLMGWGVAAAPATTLEPERPHIAVTPTPVEEPWWQERHRRAVMRAGQGKADLVFIGDSITQGWEQDGHAVWEQYYAPRRAVNLGFSGDRTEQVLWRLQHGELTGLSPKVIVVLIGTNNTGMRQDPPDRTVEGIQATLAELHRLAPESTILLLLLFPREWAVDDPLRRLNQAVNDRLRAWSWPPFVTVRDPGAQFMGADGRLPAELLPDALHLSAEGYRLWAEAMEPTLRALLHEKESRDPR